MEKKRKSGYIEAVLKEAEALIDQAPDRQAVKIALNGLLTRKILESFKNGVQAGKKGGYKGK